MQTNFQSIFASRIPDAIKKHLTFNLTDDHSKLMIEFRGGQLALIVLPVYPNTTYQWIDSPTGLRGFSSPHNLMLGVLTDANPIVASIVEEVMTDDVEPSVDDEVRRVFDDLVDMVDQRAKYCAITDDAHQRLSRALKLARQADKDRL